jgi:DNA-binding response OmpR family regulator
VAAAPQIPRPPGLDGSVQPGDPASLDALLDELRRAADAAATLCVALQHCIDRAVHALDTQTRAPARDQPAIHLVGRPAAAERLAGPIPLHGFLVDAGRHTVQRGRRTASLTPNEWQLFALLLAEPQRIFTREELATGAWGHGFGGRDSEVEVYISRLRRKLEADPRAPVLIETVRGSGYRFIPPDGALPA